MSAMPEGWRHVTLGEVCDKPKYGWTTSAASIGDLRLLRTTDLTHGPIDWNSVPYCKESPKEISGFEVKPGDIFISRAGSVGVSVLVKDVPVKSVFASYLIRLRPTPEVDVDYLALYLQSPTYWSQISDMSSGIALPNINASKLSRLGLPLPPLDEQRRIVAILEDHLSRLEVAERSIVRAEKLASQMLQAALIRGTTPQIGWTATTLGDLAQSVRNGIFVSRPSADPIGIPILRIGAVRSLHLDLTDLRYTARQVSDFDEEKQLIKAGDLLFTRYNGNPDFVAACAEVPSLDYEVTYPDKLIRMRLRTDLAYSTFVAMACSVGLTRTFLKSKVKTTAGQAGISGSDVKAAPIFLPPLDKQMSLAEEFRELRDEQESALACVVIARQRTEGLRRSLLAAAFSGQLTKEPSLV